MRILLITSELPYPAASGGALRVTCLLKGLHSAAHDVTLLCFGIQQPTPLDTLCQVIAIAPPSRPLSSRLKLLITSNQPDIATRLWSDAMLALIHDLHTRQPFDVIQCEGIEMACYLPAIRNFVGRAKLVFDTFNAEANLQAMMSALDWQEPRRMVNALYSTIQTRRLFAYEARLCQLADAIITVSPEDMQALKIHAPHKMSMIPSGIVVADYVCPTAVEPLPARTLVFTGKMDYRPNVDAMLWFAEAILPRLKDVNVVIVGQKPTRAITALVQKHPIRITGWVDSVVPYLCGAALYIAPLRIGSGTRLKILEALACECAIVATNVAASGLDSAVTATMHIADSPDAFAQAINHLLDDPQARQHLRQQARAAVTAHYDWQALTPALLQVYERLQSG